MAAQVASSVLDRSLPECRRRWEATFEIDQDDPFFFDHPLDHAPAMLLLEGVLRTAERAGAEWPRVVAGCHLAVLRLEFRQFCELSPAPVVRVWADADPDRSGRWEVEFRQGGVVIGAGEIGWRPTAQVPTGPGGRPGTLPEPAPAQLVHRWRPENVLVGGLTKVAADTYDIGVLPPPPGHYFRRQDARFRSIGELVEAVRQFGILLGHTACEMSLGTQFVVRSLGVELARRVSRDEPLTILTRSLPPVRGRGKGPMTFAFRAGEETVGTAALYGLAFSAEAFARLRARSGR